MSFSGTFNLPELAAPISAISSSDIIRSVNKACSPNLPPSSRTKGTSLYGGDPHAWALATSTGLEDLKSSSSLMMASSIFGLQMSRTELAQQSTQSDREHEPYVWLLGLRRHVQYIMILVLVRRYCIARSQRSQTLWRPSNPEPSDILSYSITGSDARTNRICIVHLQEVILNPYTRTVQKNRR